MSRIGNKPVALPSAVKVAVNNRLVTVEAGGKKLTYTHRPEVTVTVDEAGKQVVVARRDDSRTARAMHGLTRALISNMITGVTTGFVRDLEINGVGWTAKLQGKKVVMNIGYADMREVEVPAGVTVEIAGNKIKVSGSDKQAVGQLAANIRAQRPPEPYNGKGIKYAEEVIIRKQGKAFAGGGA